MDYQEFLQRSGERDSPSLRQAFQKQFGGSDNLGLGSQIELQERGVHGRLMSNPNEVLYSNEGQEGKNFLVATDRYHNPNEFQLSGALEEQQALDALRNEELLSNPFDGTAPITEYSDLSKNREFLLNPQNSGVLGEGEFTQPVSGMAGASQGLLGSTSALPTGASGYASLDATAGTGLDFAGQGISEELAAQTAAEAGSSAWGGPATFAANQALNMIPTRDRDKKVTPLGDQGSVSGILKGTGKGALLGGTIGSAFAGIGAPVGAVVGGAAGLIGGAQGYFDSTSAPQMNMSRIKRRGGGMQGGLLGGGSFYG